MRGCVLLWPLSPGLLGVLSVFPLAVLPSSERRIALSGFTSAILHVLNPVSGLCQVLVSAEHCTRAGQKGMGEGNGAAFLLLEIPGDAHSGPCVFQKVVALSQATKAHFFPVSVRSEWEFGNGSSVR